MLTEKKITIRLTEQEWKILDTYCQQQLRNKTDVLRECIRKLTKKVRKSERL
jgi:hypothetical protein